MIIRYLPVGVHLIQYGLEFRVRLPSLHEGNIISQGAQAGFQLLMFQLPTSVLVKMPEKNIKIPNNV